jgi:segregation and condensation protein B
MNLKSAIEAILFVAGRPVALEELGKVLTVPEAEIKNALEELKNEHLNTGIIILEQDKSYLLSSNPDFSPQVKEFLNAELREKLTDAALETLAIVTYKQPVTRAEIEAIRGVNSQYTLRLLLMRGLIERIHSVKDARLNLYHTTHEFLQHLGLKDIKELPDFEELVAKVKPPEDLATPSLRAPGEVGREVEPM